MCWYDSRNNGRTEYGANMSFKLRVPCGGALVCRGGFILRATMKYNLTMKKRTVWQGPTKRYQKH